MEKGLSRRKEDLSSAKQMLLSEMVLVSEFDMEK